MTFLTCSGQTKLIDLEELAKNQNKGKWGSDENQVQYKYYSYNNNRANFDADKERDMYTSSLSFPISLPAFLAGFLSYFGRVL